MGRSYTLLSVLLLLVVLAGCSHAPPAYESRYTSPPTIKPRPIEKVVVIGDSYTTQPPPWPDSVAAQLGIRIVTGGEGGSGYVQPGKNGTVFRQRVTRLVKPEDTMVVLFGGRSDQHAAPAALTTAVSDAITRVQTAAPEAKILIVGPMWPEGNPPADVLAVRDIIREQATRVGTFVDPIAEGWLTVPGLLKDDGVNPNAAGNEYLAAKMAPLIRNE